MRYLLAFLGTPLLATILNFGGFEVGKEPTEYDSVVGTGITFQTTGTCSPRSGTYALQSSHTGTGAAYYRYGKPSATTGASSGFNINSAKTGFWFCFVTAPASASEQFSSWLYSDGTGLAELRLNSTGTLSLYVGTTAVAHGATVLSSGTWYRLDSYITRGAGGAYDLTINGISEISGTYDFIDSAVYYIAFGKRVNRNSQNLTVRFDDWYVDSAAYQTTSTLKVLAVFPTGPGQYTGWTAGTNLSDYAEVDEHPPDGDTTYIKSDASGTDAATFALQNSDTVGISGTIAAVKSWIYCNEDTSGTSSIKIRTRSGSTDVDTTGASIGDTTYNHLNQLFLVDPATSSAWTTAGIDGLQVGPVDNASAIRLRCSSVGASVFFYPASSSSRKKSPNVISIF